jgi:ubiquinone/menaquinone biosynthesis C-methylase UbiE
MNNNNQHDKKVSTYFDRASATFDTFYDDKRSAFMQWVDRKFRSDVFERYFQTFENLDPLTDKRVLDIGCGSGPYVAEAAKRGAKRVVGLDMAAGMLDLGRKRVASAGTSDKCEFILGTFPQNSPDETFDYSITMGVMDYIASPLSFLEELAKVVECKSVLSFPCNHWFRTPVRKFRYWVKRCPVYFYEPEKIEEMAIAAGFSRVNIHKMPHAGMDYFVTLFK